MIEQWIIIFFYVPTSRFCWAKNSFHLRFTLTLRWCSNFRSWLVVTKTKMTLCFHWNELVYPRYHFSHLLSWKVEKKSKRWYHEENWILVYEGESSFNFDSLFRTSFVLGAFAYNRLRDMVMYEPSNIRWIGRIRCVMNLTFYIKR